MSTPLISPNLYEQDYSLWLKKTSELLRSGNFQDLDIEHLIEEIEDMGGSQKDALENNLIVVLAHLLKWKYQPSHRCGSWRGSIKEHRRRLNKALSKHPGLKPYFREIFAECYPPAKEWASEETGLSRETFPEQCPFTPEETLSSDYPPEREM
jgi:hypothetical protein